MNKPYTIYIAYDSRKMRLLQGQLSGSDPGVLNIVREMMKKVTAWTQKQVRLQTPLATNRLHKTIGASVDVMSRDPIHVVGSTYSMQPYAVPVERDCVPHRPPFYPIRNWVMIKFGLRGKQATSVAWAVVKGIEKHGTKGAHMFAKGLRNSRVMVDTYMGAAADRISRLFGGD